jgi:hypothetical protein
METTKQCEWAFGLAEYRQMFALSDEELTLSLLDFSASMSSFNAEVAHKNSNIISADASYDLPISEMENHVACQIDELAAHFVAHADHIADAEHSPKALLESATRTASIFFKDYEAGMSEGRYVCASLPSLPFGDYQFNLALCSHWLFSESPDSFFQIQAIKELMRVAGEVRIYPLLNRDDETAASLGPVMMALQQENFGVELREVDFELKKEGNAMLRVWARECIVK